MKRNKILSVLLVVLILTFNINCITYAKGNDTNYNVNCTIENANEYANKFAESVCDNKDIYIERTIKVYDIYSNAIGYCVDYYNSGKPYGYIIIDTTKTNNISEYAFTENSKSIYSKLLAKNNLSYDTTDVLIQENQLSYVLLRGTEQKAIFNELGEMIQPTAFIKAVMKDESLIVKAKNPATWKDVFLDIKKIYENYAKVEELCLDNYYPVTESDCTSRTQHYCCAVSGMYICAGLLNLVNYNDFKNDYIALWNLSGTRTDSTINNIQYGATRNDRIGDAFIKFCSSKGLNGITSIETVAPSFSFYKEAVNNGRPSLFNCGIYTTSGREGHSMAVEGYSVLREKNTGSEMKVIIVYDGWDEPVRFLNYDFSYMDTYGIKWLGCKVAM